MAWTPKVTCNLYDGQQEFQVAVKKFRDWAKDQPLPTITLTTGWHTITPELAEKLLIGNKHNRKLRYPDSGEKK